MPLVESIALTEYSTDGFIKFVL